MNLKEKLKSISDKYVSDKTKAIDSILEKIANQGKTIANLDSKFYDYETIEYLRKQGLSVEEIRDNRDGDFIIVSWD